MQSDVQLDILASVRSLIEERDALRARNQELDALSRRQGVVIAKFTDAVTELQTFLDETQMIVAPEAAVADDEDTVRPFVSAAESAASS